MLLGHLMHYPAIGVIIAKLTDFPVRKIWGPEEEMLEENIELLVKGLIWRKPEK